MQPPVPISGATKPATFPILPPLKRYWTKRVADIGHWPVGPAGNRGDSHSSRSETGKIGMDWAWRTDSWTSRVPEGEPFPGVVPRIPVGGLPGRLTSRPGLPKCVVRGLLTMWNGGGELWRGVRAGAPSHGRPKEQMMAESPRLTHVTTLCGQCNCGCPEVFVDAGAAPERRVLITDDFGQRVQMSLDQFRQLVEQARAGDFDEMLDHLAVG